MSKQPQLNPFRAARNYVGLTQQQVSRLTGLAPSIISELENGTNTNPTWAVLGRLCVVYRRRPEELLPWPKLPNHARSRSFRPSGSNLAEFAL